MKKIMVLCVLFSLLLIGCSNNHNEGAPQNGANGAYSKKDYSKMDIDDITIKSENVDKSKLNDEVIRAVARLEDNGMSVYYVKDGKGGYKATIRDEEMMIYLNGYRGIEDDIYIMHHKTYHDFTTNFIGHELEENFEYIYIKNDNDDKFSGYPIDTSRLSEEDAKITKETITPYLEHYEVLKDQFKMFREKIGIVDFNELAELVEHLTSAYDGKKEEAPVKTEEEQIKSRCNADNSGSFIMLENGDMATCP